MKNNDNVETLDMFKRFTEHISNTYTNDDILNMSFAALENEIGTKVSAELVSEGEASGALNLALEGKIDTITALVASIIYSMALGDAAAIKCITSSIENAVMTFQTFAGAFGYKPGMNKEEFSKIASDIIGFGTGNYIWSTNETQKFIKENAKPKLEIVKE